MSYRSIFNFKISIMAKTINFRNIILFFFFFSLFYIASLSLHFDNIIFFIFLFIIKVLQWVKMGGVTHAQNVWVWVTHGHPHPFAKYFFFSTRSLFFVVNFKQINIPDFNKFYVCLKSSTI